MTRAVFKAGELDEFLNCCKQYTSYTLPKLAKMINVERHTLNDWRRGKRLPKLEHLKTLANCCDTQLPIPLELKPDNWGSSKAGKVRQKIYGCTLTHDDRVKAGTNSQQRRREYPEYYSQLGCNVAKTFTLPIYPSIELAELVGILLGDGGITHDQFTITLNSIKDEYYSQYVKTLISNIFSYTPTLAKRKDANAIILTTSGVEIIKYLVRIGLHIGDKVKQQVDVPGWIKDNPNFSRWCLRGLMDTDGGIFTNPYIINGKSYIYPKTNFTNASQPLLDFVYRTLKNNGFHPNNKMPRKVWLYSQQESIKYLHVIGSSNERLLSKVR